MMKATQTTDHTTSEVTELLSLVAVCVGDNVTADDREEAEVALEFLLLLNPVAAKQCKRELEAAIAAYE